MKNKLLQCCAVLLLCNVSAGAHAKVVTFDRAGAWEAFGGTTSSGTEVCGVSSSGTGKYFSVKYFSGEDSLTIQLGASSWNIKDGAQERLVIQIDNEDPWRATGRGIHFSDGDGGLEFDISRRSMKRFIGEFRAGSVMYVRFPDSDVADWRASLTGSDAIFDSFARCLKRMGE